MLSRTFGLFTLCLALLLPFTAAVIIEPGTYANACNSTNAPITLSAPGVYFLTNQSHAPPSGVPCFYINSSNVVADFANGTVAGLRATGNYGIEINNSNVLLNLFNITVRNVTLSNFGTAISFDYAILNGTSLASNHSVLIHNVTVNNSITGISFGVSGYYVNISNSVFVNNSQAIYSLSTLNNSLFSKNSFTNGNVTSVGIAITLFNSGNLTIFNNTFVNNYGPFMLNGLVNSNVSNNNVTRALCGSGSCTAINVAPTNGNGGGNTIANNWLLTDVATASLHLVAIRINNSNNVITGNIIDNFSSGVNFSGGISGTNNLTHNVIRNVWWGVGQAINVSNLYLGNVLIFNNTITNVSEAIVIDPGNATYNVSSNVITAVTQREGILFLDAPSSNATVIVWNNTVVNVTNVNLGTGIDLLRLNATGIGPQVVFNYVNNTGLYGIMTRANDTNISNNHVNFTRLYGIYVDVFVDTPWNVIVQYNNLVFNNLSMYVGTSLYTNLSFNTISSTLNGSAILLNTAINATVFNNTILNTNISTARAAVEFGQGAISINDTIPFASLHNVTQNTVSGTFGVANGIYLSSVAYANLISNKLTGIAAANFYLNNSNATLYNVSANLSNVTFDSANTYSRLVVLHPVNVSVYAGSLSSPFNGSASTVNVTLTNSLSKQLNSSTALNLTGSVLFNATVYELFSTSTTAANINHTAHSFGASVSGYDAGTNTTTLSTGVFEAMRQISIVLTATAAARGGRSSSSSDGSQSGSGPDNSAKGGGADDTVKEPKKDVIIGDDGSGVDEVIEPPNTETIEPPKPAFDISSTNSLILGLIIMLILGLLGYTFLRR